MGQITNVTTKGRTTHPLTVESKSNGLDHGLDNCERGSTYRLKVEKQAEGVSSWM